MNNSVYLNKTKRTMTIGKSIQIIRRTRAKENQSEFSLAIGIGQGYLSRIENDHCTPTVDLLNRIAKHVGIPTPILFWFGVEENDIHEDKLDAFRIFKPTIDSMMNEIIKTK